MATGGGSDRSLVPFQPAHVKACFLGSSLTIPVTEGRLNVGTWQVRNCMPRGLVLTCILTKFGSVRVNSHS